MECITKCHRVNQSILNHCEKNIMVQNKFRIFDLGYTFLQEFHWPDFRMCMRKVSFRNLKENLMVQKKIRIHVFDLGNTFLRTSLS